MFFTVINPFKFQEMNTNEQPGIYNLDRIPDYLYINRYIHNGYRVHFTRLQCVKSIFMITNETGNIWSHLIGTLIFLYLLYQVNHVLYLFEKTSPQDHVIVTIFCLSCICCLLFSSSYHIFNCYSKESYDLCLRLDLLGISISICGIYLLSIYYAFYCVVFWRSLYSVMVILMIVINIMLQVIPRRLYTEKTDYKRILLFVAMVLFGIIPACHWIVIMGGFSDALVQQFIPQLVIMYLLGATAFFFYITKIPERFLPGYCDYVGHSHQFWHIMVLIAFLWWYSCSLDLIKYRLDKSNACANSSG